MKGVDAAGGPSDGKIINDVTSYEQALDLAKKEERNDLAFTWHRPSKRFIYKPPEKKSGQWVDDDNCNFFIWADSCISSEFTPEEL